MGYLTSSTRPDTAAASTWLRKYAHFEGEAPPPAPPVTPPPATPPVNNGGNNGDDDEQPIMSSAQLKERLERDRKAQREKFMKEYGIEDPDADKELLAAARKRKADEQTAAEKALEDLAKERKKREDAEAALAKREAEIAAKERADALNGAVKDALTKANAKADKVLKLLRADHADALDAVLKDDGTADEKKVTALVETARKAYPEDFGKGGVGSPSNAGGHSPDPNREGKERARAELRNFTRSRF
jgi:predicted nucleic acid-binding Zn ribbon protein